MQSEPRPWLRSGLLCLLSMLVLCTAQAQPQRSGLSYASPGTQAMQKDSSQNPGMLWVKDGAQRFQEIGRAHV